MHTPNSKWDVERAAAWLRKHAWGEAGEAAPPALDEQVVAAAEAAGADPGQEPKSDSAPDPASPLGEEEEIDIAGWPALVAPFYD